MALVAGGSRGAGAALSVDGGLAAASREFARWAATVGRVLAELIVALTRAKLTRGA